MEGLLQAGVIGLASGLIIAAAGANLTDAELPGVDLTNANLEGANLTGASLFGGTLGRTDVFGRDFSAATEFEEPACPTLAASGFEFSGGGTDPSSVGYGNLEAVATDAARLIELRELAASPSPALTAGRPKRETCS